MGGRGVTLDELPRGTAAVVTQLDMTGADRRRFMDMGLLPGTRVVVDMTSPLGDPTAYLVRGSVIALRRSQARGVRIEIDADAPSPDIDTETDREAS